MGRSVQHQGFGVTPDGDAKESDDAPVHSKHAGLLLVLGILLMLHIALPNSDRRYVGGMIR